MINHSRHVPVSTRWLTGLLIVCFILAAAGPVFGQKITGVGAVRERPLLKKWHPLTITFEGPATGEQAELNPFRNYRLSVIFTHAASGRTYRVPGFFAADGQAAETSATEGNKWRVRFTPGKTGQWTYTASFRKGPDIAVSLDPYAGTPVAFDGTSGSFTIGPTDKAGRDFRGKGFLEYVGERYLRFSNGDYFLKGGADSPENFLAYAGFDGTFDADGRGASPGEQLQPGEALAAEEAGGTFLHHYRPHVSDWQPGDPTWQDGKGKGIIGALNYLASEGMNSVYFLTMNVQGDGNDVWPWVSPTVRDRFDVSKLAQWNIVFNHMNRSGIVMHVLTQETENDQLLNGGNLGLERKLYYRELIARFGHHPALIWNLGEENTNTSAQRKAFASYIRELDPYDHPIVVHTYPGQYDKVYTPLLGFPDFEGPSLQMGNMKNVHSETLKWVNASAIHGRPWFVSVDEIGPASTGVMPDGPNDNHAAVRHYALWGNLMAGGAGVEWYFGYEYPHNDLNAEDWRSRDEMWDYTRYALSFFQQYLPFPEMQANDRLSSAEDDYVLAKEGAVYAIYLPNGGSTDLSLKEGSYTIRWYNPRTGGPLKKGALTTVSGPGWQSVGQPPTDTGRDWVVLVRQSE